MGMLGLILILEIWPMITLIRWRMANQRGGLDVDTLSVTGQRMARISDVQTLLLIGMVFAAAMMARGYGVR
jgi:putative membrane protein